MKHINRIWLITDTHFGHENIKKWCNRPDDYEERIIKGLLSISKDDILIHLGDVAWKNWGIYHSNVFSSLLCKKILVRGNHDKQSDSWFYRHGWNFVCTSLRNRWFGKDILLSHIPMETDADYNIHGHFHNSDHRRWEPEYTKILTSKHILLAIENTGYRPILLESLIKGLK